MDSAVTDPAYEKIDIIDAVMLPNMRHVVQCMIWAPCVKDEEIVNEKDSLSYFTNHNSAAIRIQLRLDGAFGFTRVLVLDDFEQLSSSERIELIVIALNKELKENLNLRNGMHAVYCGNHLFSHKDPHGKLVSHFFELQMTYDEFREFELDGTKSQDFGEDLLGLFRVPLYTMENGYGGFPAFLDNAFVGNSKQQLLMALEALKIMKKEEIEIALRSSKCLKSK